MVFMKKRFEGVKRLTLLLSWVLVLCWATLTIHTIANILLGCNSCLDRLGAGWWVFFFLGWAVAYFGPRLLLHTFYYIADGFSADKE